MSPVWTKQHEPKTDCKHFRGHIPCKPHKQTGVLCGSCDKYEPLKGRILIIKLGAAGDVIRTTPLLRRIRQDLPQAEIVWLTYFPDLVPSQWVNKVIAMELPKLLWLQAQQFDWLINLDKDDEAIALAEKIQAKRKSGFGMSELGKCRPLGQAAENTKWMTGLWDDLNKANRQSYMQEIFAICGYTFSGETYIVEHTEHRKWPEIERKAPVIGLNTGCGGRWVTRLWDDRHWVSLASQLRSEGRQVILLGGPAEHERNVLIAKQTGAQYLGHFSLPVFIDLLDQCDAVVTQVTMAMHLVIGLGKKLVLMNNIFNEHEFHLYGKGAIIQPALPCLGCFKQAFDKRCPVSNCMDLIAPDAVAERVRQALDAKPVKVSAPKRRRPVARRTALPLTP